MKNVKVIPKGDGDKMAFQAGAIILRHKKHNISMVDSYILSAAMTEGAIILTADNGIREAAEEEHCEVNFIPQKELEKYMAQTKSR
jgi:rRNA-processing protein FCF1